MGEVGTPAIDIPADVAAKRPFLSSTSLSWLTLVLALGSHSPWLLIPLTSVFGNDRDMVFRVFDIPFMVMVLLGLLSPFLSIRFLSTYGDLKEDKDVLNQTRVGLALLIFALNIFNPFTLMYCVRMFIPPDNSKGPVYSEQNASLHFDSALRQVYSHLRDVAEQDSAKCFPPLSIRSQGARQISNQTDLPQVPVGYPLRTYWEGKTYFYLGHAVANDQEMAALAEAYRNAVKEEPEVLSGAPGSHGPFRLGLSGPPSRVRHELPLPDGYRGGLPLLIENMGGRRSGEGLVLFADGHIESLAYPGRWPMTETTMRLLEQMEAMTPMSGKVGEGE